MDFAHIRISVLEAHDSGCTFTRSVIEALLICSCEKMLAINYNETIFEGHSEVI